MKLYWGKHTCAIGIHMLLEEIGKPYETEKIDVGGGDTHQPRFLAVNPKGKVPTLIRDDGSVLTEFTAIGVWLAGFAILDPQLGRHDFAAGASITVADFALFYAEHWAQANAVLPPINVKAHYQRMLARRAVHSIAETYQ